MSKTRIAIIFHSGYGHTKALAESVADGVRRVDDVDLRVLTAEEATDDIDSLDEVDGMIWGCPTYMAGPSADWKSFADATSKPWMERKWIDKMAAGFSNSGSLHGDKQNTLQYFVGLAMQHGMIWVGQSELGPSTESGHGGKPDDVNRVGSYLGLMAQSDNAPPSEAPSPGDHETARIFGERVARAMVRWTHGPQS